METAKQRFDLACIDIGIGNAQLFVTIRMIFRMKHRAGQGEHMCLVHQIFGEIVRAHVKRMPQVGKIGPKP